MRARAYLADALARWARGAWPKSSTNRLETVERDVDELEHRGSARGREKLTPIEVVIVTGTLGAGPEAFGAVLTTWGAGMVAGGAPAARAEALPVTTLLVLSSLATALACVGMGVSSSLVPVLGWAVIGGLGNGAYGMSFLTALQERTPATHQTCINGLYELAGSAAPGLGFLVGGIVATAFSPRAVYMIAGVGGLAVTLCTARALRTADWCVGPIAAGADQ